MSLMEIQDIETFLVGSPEPHKGGMNFVFVKVTTTDGAVGYGECPWAEYRGRTLAALIDELKDAFIVGSSPFNIEDLRRKLYRSNPALHVPGPLQAQAIAGIELACWDLVGKHVGEPVYNLLGGKVNDPIRSYTYLHYKWTPPEPPEEAAAAVREYVDQGFTGVKLDPIPPYEGPRSISLEELSYADRVVGTIREEVGDECDILIGTHGQLTTESAIRLAERLEPHDPLWFEEPVPPERVDEMVRVNRSTSIPVATGERLTTVHQAAEVLESGAADIIQPNVGMVGLLEAKKITAMAEAHYAAVAPWMYCGPIAGAANLHLDATTPNFLIQEGIERWGEFHAEILEDPVSWEDGYVEPPSDPGLGVELDEMVIEEYPFNEMSPDDFSWF